MKADTGFLKLKLLIIWVFIPLLLSSQDTLISVSEKYGIFYVPNYGEWTLSDQSNDDFFVFGHKNSGAIVKIKKEQVSVQSSQEFNRQILQYIQGLNRNQEFVELRKQFVPIRLFSQKGSHFLKVKSRQSGNSKFVFNPEVDKKMFHIEIFENKSGNEPSEDVIRFISAISLSPISAMDIASEKTKDALLPEKQADQNKNGQKDDLSSFKKVKSLPVEKSEKIPVNGQKDKAVTDKDTKDQGVGQSNQIDKSSGLPGEKEKIDVSKGNDEIPTSNDQISKTSETVFDPAISEEAAKIIDGDELEPVINPVGTIKILPSDAAWAIGQAKMPKELLDAMEGGRPGGDVSALVSLLRQSQGPFDEAEDRALMQKFAPYGISGSENAHDAIRAQSEFLMQGIIKRQLMTQSAWEYDFAIAQNEIANLMKDEDEMEVTAMLAEIQRKIMQEQQISLEEIEKKSEAAKQIPTVEELKAEDEKERKNAMEALEIESTDQAKNEYKKHLVGYLRYESTYIKVLKREGLGIADKPEENGIVKVLGNNSVSFYQIRKIGSGIKPGTEEFWMDDVIESYECSWQTPATIPVFASCVKYDDGSYKCGEQTASFNAIIKNTGSKAHSNKGVVSLEVGVGCVASSSGGDEPAETTPTGDNNRIWNLDNLLIRVPESGLPLDNEFAFGTYHMDGKMSEMGIVNPTIGEYYIYIILTDKTNFGAWTAYNRFKWEAVDISQPNSIPTAMTGDQIKDEAIAEHQANIVAAEKALKSINEEMSKETDIKRREDLRLQALHMRQNVHDSKDLIESIKSGTIVKTRGPWDEHVAVVLVETSRKLREEFQRASQMQASYARMLNIIKKYDPVEAEKFRQKMSDDMIKGIFDQGGFDKAQKALDAIYISAKAANQTEQKKLESQHTKADDYLKMVERHLSYVETVKSGCDKAIFVGTFFTGLAPGLVLSMAYEGSCTTAEKGPKQALKNMVVQGGIMLAMAGTMKLGSWGIGKLLNPKVAQSEVNTFKNILEKHRFDQEMEWNKALVNQLKEKVAAFEKSKAAGGKNYLEVRKALDDAVAAANSSTLAKRIMKNELTMLENQIKSGATRDYSKLKECLGYQKVFDNRLQKSIYPRADAEMISKLRSQGYNVEKSWFQEFRNACSRGVNADRDAGLIAAYEKMVMKNKQPVSMTQFMDEAQKAYDASYKAITGRSAKLADQSITSTAHNEAFPLSWLQKKMEGPISNLDPPVTPQDFEKAGSAIYNKVKNALKGSDPEFVKLQKACASLSKDLKSKVFERLQNPPNNITTSPESRKAALEYWKKVQQVMEDFATGNSDPLTTMKKLQNMTGSNSIIESAEDVQKLLNNLGGVK